MLGDNSYRKQCERLYLDRGVSELCCQSQQQGPQQTALDVRLCLRGKRLARVERELRVGCQESACHIGPHKLGPAISTPSLLLAQLQAMVDGNQVPSCDFPGREFCSPPPCQGPAEQQQSSEHLEYCGSKVHRLSPTSVANVERIGVCEREIVNLL